jgi:hypothetical protein
MAYDRYDSRRGWREPRGRFGDDFRERGDDRFGRDRDDDRNERGFFERAGDEVASWFGDDEAERRRREDMRRYGDDDSQRRSRFSAGDDDFSRYDRSPRFRDEGYRRLYTGRFFGRGGFGGEDRFDRGPSSDRLTGDRWTSERQRESGGITAGGLHDPHYSEWRRRQLDELDRDYDDYRRENQSRFESDFGNWRTQRQSKRQLLGEVREHMTVVGSDEEQVGTVDHVRGDRIILSKSGSDDDRHHLLSCSMIDRVEGDRVILDQPAAEAKQRIQDEGRDSGFYRDSEERDDGRILNRAFSGTYER